MAVTGKESVASVPRQKRYTREAFVEAEIDVYQGWTRARLVPGTLWTLR